MNPLLLALAALLSVCSGQPRFFNPRRVTASRQLSFDQGYEAFFPTRRRTVQQFGGSSNFNNFNQDNVNLMPLGGQRGGAVGGRQFGGGNFDLDTVGMLPTSQFRVPSRRRPTARRVVARRPFRRIARRLNRPIDDGPIREGYIGARGGVDGFPIFGGYCAGDMCKDGGQAVGVGNGYGPGSLSAFLERRRTGRNEDIRLYERFASGPNGNNALQNPV